eukprot:TRINITY_DN8776_c0_g3_i1.p1 TRINITY_DN8776_c0_g3~~TRINITY_DN8776_c0_g3_i1.p1  ORF type:complete len:112 (-),score=5.14 TRINITY_DN8776_c0_g3_i1:1968-2303(-)
MTPAQRGNAMHHTTRALRACCNSRVKGKIVRLIFFILFTDKRLRRKTNNQNVKDSHRKNKKTPPFSNNLPENTLKNCYPRPGRTSSPGGLRNVTSTPPNKWEDELSFGSME